MAELIAAAPSRIVNVSSEAHRRGIKTVNLDDPMLRKEWNTGKAYSQSKLANIIFTTELGHRLKG